MADNKKVTNYNISTEYENAAAQQNEQDDRNFFEKTIDTVGSAAHVVSNRLFGDKDASIKKAQDAQSEIDDLKERYYNGNYSTDEKNQMATKIGQLRKIRDDALSGEDLGGRDRRDWLMRQWNPITENDIYEYSRNQAHSVEDYNQIKSDSGGTLAGFLKATNKANEQTYTNNIISQAKKDLEDGKTTEEDIKSGKYFAQLGGMQDKGVGFDGYLRGFLSDSMTMSTPYAFSLSDNNGVTPFFKEDAAKVIETITTSDDIIKAIQNNYNVIKKVEGWLNSEDAGERKYAENNQRVQEIYKTAVKNLNQLKQEVAYVYDNFGKFNGDMFAIEEQYYKDNGRKMFSNADTSVWFRAKNETYTSEDWATMAVHDLDVYGNDFIQHEYPNTREAVKGNLLSPLKRGFDNISYLGNQIRDAWQEGSNDLAVLSNTVYGTIGALAELDFSLSDVEDILLLKQSRIPLAEITKENYEMAKTTQMGMGSLHSIKQALTRDDSFWNSMYNDALRFADASPTVSKEALAFALTEGMLESIGVVGTADMVKATAEGSTQYARLVAYNKGLMKFDTQGIVYAKLHEFVGRGLAQNYILSASAMGNFSEEYSQFDFGMDVAFGMIDVFTLGHTFLGGKGKIALEAKKNIQRAAFRDTLRITDDQRQIIMSTSQGKKLVDKLAAEMFDTAMNSIEQLAKNKSTTREEIIAEISKAVKKARKNGGGETMKLYRQQRNEILKHLEDITFQAAASAVYNGKNLPQNILDKVGVKKVTDINGDIMEIPYWKKKITSTEFLTILRESKVPAFTKMWNNIQNIWKSGHNIQDTLENRLEELNKIDRTTEQGRLQYDIKSRELEKEYNKMLRDELLEPKNFKNIEDARRVDPNMFRRREYEKYGRPNGYSYGDIEYTIIGQTKNAEEAKKLLAKRKEEYAAEIEDLVKEAREQGIGDYQYVRGLTKSAIEMSDRLTGKKNLIGLSFEEACEINPNLKNVGEDFFIEVTLADWLELYQKNMILWSVTPNYKIPKEGGAVIEFRKGNNQIFGSMFEQEHFLGKAGWMGTVFIEDKKLHGAYGIIRTREGIYKITVKDERGGLYKFNMSNGKIIMDKSTSKKTGGEINISFKPNGSDREATTWKRYSGDFELFGEQGKQFYDNMGKKIKETPIENEYLSVIQKAEIALKKDLSSGEFKGNDEGRNWYQSDKAADTFKNSNMLSSSQMKSGYLDIVSHFDVPYSYYIEVKIMIRKGLITEREGAALLLSASGSSIIENADYFIMGEGARLKGNLQTFAMHQCGVVALPFGNVKEGGFKMFFYERETGRNGIYNLYSTESQNVKVGRLGINPDTGVAIVAMEGGEPTILKEYRIDKHIAADYDSKKYKLIKRSDVYFAKRTEEYNKFLKKAEIGNYNFEQTVETNYIDRFRRITKGDNRGLYTSFNKDISVDNNNRKEINDIYRFKNTSIKAGGKNLGLFNSWFRYSLLPKFYKLNFGVSTAGEGKSMLLNMKKEGLLKYNKVIDTKGDHARIIIDTEGMGFKINYIEFEYGKSKKKGQSLLFNIDDKNIPGGRAVSIDFIGNHKIENIDGQLYLRVVDDKNLDYYIKLDTDIKRPAKFDINTLSLSKSDYENFVEFPGITSKLIGEEENSYFIQKNLFALPNEVKDLIDRGATSVEVYNYMKQMIEENELMSEIFKRNGMSRESASVLDTIGVYQEYVDILNSVERLNQIGINVPKENLIKYYNQVLSHGIFGNKTITDIFDSLGLNDFRETKDSDAISQWIFNYQTLDKKRLKMTGTSYNYMQAKVMIQRLSEFVDAFKSGEFKNGLDLSKVEDNAKYIQRIKINYEYAISIVDTKDIRRSYNEVIRESRTPNKIGEATVNNLNKISQQANSIASFGELLSELQSGLKKFRKTKIKFDDGENFWRTLFFNEDGTYRNIENIIGDIDRLISEGMSKEELLNRIYYGLLQSNSKKEATGKILKLEREYIGIVNGFKKVYGDFKIKANQIIDKGNEINRGELYDENLKKDLEELRGFLLAGSDDPNKIKFVDDRIKELEKLGQDIGDGMVRGEDVSKLQEKFVTEYTSAVEGFNEARDEMIRIQENSKTLVKEDLVESYNETKEIKPEPEESQITPHTETENTSKIEEKIAEEEKKIEQSELKEETEEIKEQIEELELDEAVEEVQEIKKELGEDVPKKKKEKSPRKTASEKNIKIEETEDYYGHQRDLTKDANMSQLLGGPERNGEGIWGIFNDVGYILDKDGDATASKVKNSLLLNFVMYQTPRDKFIKYLESGSNFKSFVQSGEGTELMLYALYYHLPIPHKLLKAIDDVYSLGIFAPNKTLRIKTYDEIYSKFKQAYSLNKGYDVRFNEGYGTFSINKGNIRTDSFFKQYDVYRIDQGDTWFNGLRLKDENYAEHHQRYIYDTKSIKDAEFTNEYKKYISNSQERGAYYSASRNSGPLSTYEFFTLRKLSAVNDDAKRYLDDMMKGKGRYFNIPYGQGGEGRKRRNTFYEMLESYDNKEEFKKFASISKDNDSFFYSPYYMQKRRDLSKDSIKDNILPKENIKYDEDGNEIYEAVFSWEGTREGTVVKQIYVSDFSNFKNNIDEIKKSYDKSIIQGGDVNEIKKYLDGNKMDFDYDIRYSDEVEVTFRKETEKEIKQSKNTADNNAKNAVKGSCKL